MKGASVQSYRAYRLNPAGRIIAGEWIEAETDGEAIQRAHALCDEGTPNVELWKRDMKIALLPCHETAA